ncbi:glycoside hydrolase family 88 protein [Aaosphaeria arxii CBS 175.79]|uniref:Glycoside hydrolase family 88 protein n=1 Tax=Aaosphaeria arxii CBS 175.79 TaxID=1450172 RepID=A0A6A5XNQ7_9PLEO|nr:glycoside hydrolase family 88 protein [Aaosphaeria arxii CBS 175.79]KAF2014370.1 glycoside hydrolase family 88 protein [Aaosphaeria arxii CBS 175.79]
MEAILKTAESPLAVSPPLESSPEQNSDTSVVAADDISEIASTPLTSASPSELGDTKERQHDFTSDRSPIEQLKELFDENITAKLLRTATTHIGALPFAFPEYVPQDGDGSYTLRESAFWTLGFFPGSLYAILERLIKFPHTFTSLNSAESKDRIDIPQLRQQFSSLCRTWTEPLHGMADRTDTHDIGFIVMPALRADWECTGNPRSLDSIIRAADSLASRYVPSAKAIRSWDLLKKKDIEIIDQEDNMIVIIDSLCNLDLLYYASKHKPNGNYLADMATAHARTLLQSHLRPEDALPTSKDGYRGQWYSTCHVANIDPKTGGLKCRLTAQGYAHESTWARGQAWGILGYAQTYMSTQDAQFLHAACGLAEYFLYRLETSPSAVEITDISPDGTTTRRGRCVPLWDFDAPIEDLENPLRDSSSGTIAANGMLVLSQALTSISQHRLATRFRDAALAIVEDTLAFALAPERARLVHAPYHHIGVEDVVPDVKFEGLLKFGTANNNTQARKRYANHGLVYGDYYLVEFGNRLLRMGLI